MGSILHCCAVAAFLLTWTHPASAHGVFIFAWMDGQRICTESYFSGGNNVRGGTVTMSDSQGTVLGTAATDDAGLACFDHLPARGDLTFSVLAGQGHRGQFLLPAATLTETSRAAAPARNATPGQAGGTRETSVQTHPSEPVPAASPLTEATVRSLVRQELDTALGPLRRALAEGLETREPGFRDIVGGMGWIAGLAAMVYWWANRRARKG